MMVIISYVYPATEKDVLTVLYSLSYTNIWGIKAV